MTLYSPCTPLIFFGRPLLGLILAQLLKLNGASHVVLAANKGVKTEIARNLDVADVYFELERDGAAAQWAEIKQRYPKGFDVVVSS